jgi:putative (di)nucleoside polyphosphate hydrolase
MLVNRDGLVFVGRRRNSAGAEHVDDTHAWQMPQGGIDPGEEPLKAARRELYEETSVTSAELIAEAPEWYGYDLPPEITGRVFRGRYRGQMQKWFAFRFTGEDAEIEILRPGGGRHKSEFDAWRWERFENLPGLIVPFKRPVYESVVAAFRDVVAPDPA